MNKFEIAFSLKSKIILKETLQLNKNIWDIWKKVELYEPFQNAFIFNHINQFYLYSYLLKTINFNFEGTRH